MRLSCPNVAQVEFTLRASRPWHVSHKFNKCGASPRTQVVGAFVLTLREGGGSVDVVRREIDAVLAFLSATVDLAVKRSRATPGAGQREGGMPLGLVANRPLATWASRGAVSFPEVPGCRGEISSPVNSESNCCSGGDPGKPCLT